jgi:DnaJ homolog subfamily C member 7
VFTLIRNQRRYAAALPKIDSLMKEIGSGSRDLKLLKIECLIESSRLEEALNLSNDMMRNSPSQTDIDLLVLRAKCLIRMGDTENAYKHLQQAMRSDPDNTTARAIFRQVKDMESCKERGNSAYKEGRYEEALEAWGQCLVIDPTNLQYMTKIYSNRANAFAKLKRFPYSAIIIFYRGINILIQMADV